MASASPSTSPASAPSPQTVKQALSPRPKLLELDSAQKIKKSGPASPIPSDSEDEHHLHSPTSPQRHLTSISENEDAADDDSDDPEAETARTEGMQGLQKEAEIKSGYLSKKGERRKAWKKRWFVLRSKRICYYKDDKEYKLLRDVSMNDVSTVAEVQVKRHEHVFGIVTPQRTYYVEARSHADLQDWVAQIERARDVFKRNKAEEVSVVTLEGPDTPTKGVTESSTPTGHSQPIKIAGTASPTTGMSSSGQFSSSVATSSTSPLSPDVLSSSYTSQDSSQSGLPPLTVPPNSLVQGGISGLGVDTDLKTVDARLAGQSTSSSRQRQDSQASSVQDMGSITNYGSSQNRQRAVSPGVASSSEEEDDDYFGAEATSPMQTLPTSILHSSSLDPNKVIMNGYLVKQGKRKNWRKRYFILVSSRLMYSRSHMDTRIHRQIPLARILDVVDVETRAPHQRGKLESHELAQSPVLGGGSANDKRYDNSFKIITAKRTYTVCAPDEESAIKWISAIKVLLSAQRQPASPVDAAVNLPVEQPSTAVVLPAGSSSPPIGSPATGPSRAAIAQSGGSAKEGMPSIEAKLEQATLQDGHVVAPTHARHRSVTEAAQLAVANVSQRFSAKV